MGKNRPLILIADGPLPLFKSHVSVPSLMSKKIPCAPAATHTHSIERGASSTTVALSAAGPHPVRVCDAHGDASHSTPQSRKNTGASGETSRFNVTVCCTVDQ